MKLIVCDFDNTLKVHIKSIDRELLWREESIYSFTKNCGELRRAKEKGSVLVLATGRDLDSLKRAFQHEGESIRLFDYICCTEGSVIYDRDEEVLDATWFTEDLLPCEKDIGERGINIDYSYIKENINRIIYHFETKKLFNRMLNELLSKKEYDISYDEWNIQVLPKGVNKCSAVDKIVEILELNNNEVFCFGDGENDIELFKKYNGYAMRWSNSTLAKLSQGVFDSLAEGIKAISCMQRSGTRKFVSCNYYNDEIYHVNDIIKRYRKCYERVIENQQYLEKGLDEKFNIEEEKRNYENYCSNVKNIVKGIVGEFHFFKGFHVDVVLTGSFARNTAKSYSDIDISLFYENKFYWCLRKYEELFYYVLMGVFDLPRRSVHSVLLTNSIKFDEEEEIEKRTNSLDKIITLRIQNEVFDRYVVEGDAVAVTTRVDNTSRSFRDIYNYLLFLVSENIWREWFVNFWLIMGNSKEWNLLKKEIQRLCNDRCKEIINHLEMQRICKRKKIINTCVKTVGEYKGFYQMEILMFFYDIESFLRMCGRENEHIKDSIYEYLWLLRKYAKSFISEGYIYSSHCKNQFIKLDDDRVIETKNKAITIMDIIGGVNGFGNNTNEE